MLRTKKYFKNNYSNLLKKFRSILWLLLMAFAIPQGFCTTGHIENIQTKKQREREAFLGFYYDLVKRGHFSPFYSNNLIITADIDHDFSRNGVILLALIEWLQDDSNVASKFLLKKINKYFYLEFHSFVSRFEVPKEKRALLYKTLHSLYKFQAVALPDSGIEGGGNFPFRTTLTKIIIALYMTLYSDSNYIKQRENLVYVIEKLKKELVTINEELNSAINTNDIEDFVMNLEIYVIQEPVVKHVNVKRALIITAIVLLVGGAIAYVAYKGGFEWLKDRFYEIAHTIGRGLADTTVDALISRADELGGRLVQGMVREDVSNPQAAAGNPNPNIQAMGAELGAGVVQGIWNGVYQGATYPFRAANRRLRGSPAQAPSGPQGGPGNAPAPGAGQAPSGGQRRGQIPAATVAPTPPPAASNLPVSPQANGWRNLWGLWR